MQEKYERLIQQLQKSLGEAGSDRLLQQCSQFAPGDRAAGAVWVSSLIEKLRQEAAVSAPEIFRLSCPCQISEETFTQAKRLLAEAATTGAFVESMREQRVIGRELRYVAAENAIYITKRYACEDGECGDCQTCSQDAMSRCHCDLVSASKKPIPTVYCHCAAQFYYPLFSFLFGEQVHVEPVQTLLNGDRECVFAILLDGLPLTDAERLQALVDERYPLSAKYDPAWILENEMGSHCLWLTESLVDKMQLAPGMRLLDMGCGKALTSIFLAREFGLQVFANDWWVSHQENWQRICAAGVDKLVFPFSGEAHALPYPEAFFDAIISVNSYQFYGTSEFYFNEFLVNLVKPGGQIALAVPGLYREFGDELPPHLQECEFSLFYFHSADWWTKYFRRVGSVDIELIDDFGGEGSNLMLKWEPIPNRTHAARIDNRRNLTWIRIILRRKVE